MYICTLNHDLSFCTHTQNSHDDSKSWGHPGPNSGHLTLARILQRKTEKLWEARSKTCVNNSGASHTELWWTESGSHVPHNRPQSIHGDLTLFGAWTSKSSIYKSYINSIRQYINQTKIHVMYVLYIAMYWTPLWPNNCNLVKSGEDKQISIIRII